jgi:dipeptidase
MCDTLIAAAAETTAGITLFAKNSDRKASECQTLLQFPEASHPPRGVVRAGRGRSRGSEAER